ncbi:uncharacterized protein [Maniola hyperantus]|uniref:uncharacterized protein isoform X3 n=1 Tax=Aphantopus hyperantus TaxID=2795564 RepID=UPI003749D2DF
MCACAWRLHAFTAALVLAAHLIKGAAAEQQVGVVDPAPRRAHPHRGPLHLHRRRALPGLPRGGHGHLDAAGEVRAGAGCGRVRVSGRHRAQDEPLRAAQRRRTQDRDSGRVGPVREGGQHGEPEVRHHAGAGGAGLHLLVPQRRARAQLRPQPRRDPHGAPRARHHDRQPDHLQPAARGLGQLLVLALQPRLCVRCVARAQRRAAGRHAARQRGDCSPRRAHAAAAERRATHTAGRAAESRRRARARAAVAAAVPRRRRAAATLAAAAHRAPRASPHHTERARHARDSVQFVNSTIKKEVYKLFR